MKKYLVIIPAIIVSMSFQACVKYDGKDGRDDLTYQTVGLVDGIDISDVAGDHPAISDVAFVARFHEAPGAGGGSTVDPSGQDTRIMLRMSFDKGGIRLILPENPPQPLLRNIANDIPDGFEISDKRANTVSFVEIACNVADPDRVSSFLYKTRTVDRATYDLKYIFCDRPVTITGSGQNWWKWPTTYDLRLEKGWNMVVEKTVSDADSQNVTVTNSMPNGMEWRYSMWVGDR